LVLGATSVGGENLIAYDLDRLSAPSAGPTPIWIIRAQKPPVSSSPPQVTVACGRMIALISCD